MNNVSIIALGIMSVVLYVLLASLLAIKTVF